MGRPSLWLAKIGLLDLLFNELYQYFIKEAYHGKACKRPKLGVCI